MRIGAKEEFAERLLNNMTWPERILWARLKRRQLGYSFQRQAIVLGFIVDFWCEAAGVAVEVDGSVHTLEHNQERDRRKDAAFAKAHIPLLRFTNDDVYNGMSAVLIRIWTHCDERCQLRSFSFKNIRYRAKETSDFAALAEIQEAKRMERHAQRFFNRYRKSRAPGGRWI